MHGKHRPNWWIEDAGLPPDDHPRPTDGPAGEVDSSRGSESQQAESVCRARDEQITANLDDIYRLQPSRLDPRLRRLQGRSLSAGEW